MPETVIPSAESPFETAVPPTEKSAKKSSGKGYFQKRRDMMYYRYVQVIAGQLAANARSLIDVGSWNTSMAEEMDWIPHRVALDLRSPYSSEQVIGVKADFFEYAPEQRFDFALCLQVLEHVPDAERFARKLLDITGQLLVSVPYKWPEGSNAGHCQDPVDEKKLARWFGRAPDYAIIVEEPLPRGKRGPRVNRRLIAYFHNTGEAFRLEDFPRQAARPRK